MNLKDPYAPAMLGLYTLLVFDAKRCHRLCFCNQGASAMDLHQAPSVMTFKKRLRHTYSKDTIIPETENTSALTGYKIKKALYK